VKKFLCLSAAVMLTAALSVSGQSAILLVDDFPVDGTPPPGWTVVSGTGGQAVVDGQLAITASGTGAGTGDYWKPLSSSVSSGTVFAGYDLTVTSAPTDAGDNYFSHFAVNNVGGAGFFSRVSLNLSGTDTVLGLAESTTSGSVPNVLGTTPLELNQTYRVVQSYDFTLGEAKVWLNPISEASPFLVDSSFATTPLTIGSFNFRINNVSDGNKLIDNFVVASTFDEVVTAVPEPTSMALIGVVGIGGLITRFRRKSASSSVAV
jgi:hypothetical protein